MLNTNKKIVSSLQKIARFTFYFFLAALILLNLFILLSGRIYLYKGIRNTYLKGQSGPGIYELDIFPYKTIEGVKNNLDWPFSKKWNTQGISSKDQDFLKQLKTKAFLVFKGDSLVFEHYGENHSLHTVSNSFSAAKTLVALLIGIAMEEGKIKSLDEPVGNYLKEFNSNRKEQITIRHLLIMASGLDWEESASNPLSENAESYYGTDLYGLVTRQKVITKPGQRFKYQSGNTQLLAFILEKATGKSVSDYAEEKIWRQMDTQQNVYWSLDKEFGDEKAFCCVYATARDFGRLGKLLLQKGRWGFKQIVPESYMNELFKVTNLATEEGVPNKRYAMHIWTYLGGKSPVYYCRGIKGQYIISIPSEKVVIVRLGLERLDNFVFPKDKLKDKKYCRENVAKVGHSADFFEFLRIGRAIAQY